MDAPPSWFEVEDRLDQLDREARAWLGTPFRANSAVRGAQGGVSCHLYVAKVLEAVGAVPAEAWPRGSPDRSLAQRTSLVEPFLDSREDFADVTGHPLLPGDLLGFKIGGATHHLAILLRERVIIHAIRHHGVVLGHLDDPMWARRLTRAWRKLP